MNKVAIFLNPSSNLGSSISYKRKLERIFGEYRIKFNLYITRSSDHLAELSRTYFKNYDLIVLVGGDTSFSIMVNQIMNSLSNREDYKGAVLGMLGAGSANDIARELNTGRIKDLCRAIKTKEVQKMDVGCLRIKGEEGKKYFAGTLSLGLGVTVNQGIDSLAGRHRIISKNRLLRNLIFGLYSVYRSFKERKVPLHMKISTAQGFCTDAGFSLLVFQNSATYAGGLRLNESASMFSGDLQCMMIHTQGLWKTLRLLPPLLRGKLAAQKTGENLTLLAGRSFRLESDADITLQLDGDIISGGKDIEVSLIPHFLPVIKN